jgi:DNA-binding NarL/FixJ family response regulator
MARSVLIVDDSGPFRATARALLRLRGYEVVGTVADGAGALALARRLRPDAVLLDVNLGDADGLRVAAQLSVAGYVGIIVLISTMDASVFGDAIASSGAHGFLTKSELASGRLVELLGSPHERC